MSPEPVEVEVLDKDGTPAISETKTLSPLHPVRLLAFVFAVLAAILIVLMGLALSVMAQAQKEDEELPPDPE